MHARIAEALSDTFGFAPPLPSYGVLLSVSLLLGIFLTNRALRKRGFPESERSSILLWSVAGALGGAKLLYVAQFPESVTRSGLLDLLRSGFSLYGGLLGLAAGVYWSSKRKSFVVLDAMTAPFALGLTLTRLGCFLHGCCYGRRADLPWALRFPRGSPAWLQQVRDGTLGTEAPLTHPVHPTELYEAVAGLALFGFALLLGRRAAWPSGRVFLAVLALYAIFRALEEAVRADAGGLAFGRLTFSQGISVALFGAAAILVLRRSPSPPVDLH